MQNLYKIVTTIKILMCGERYCNNRKNSNFYQQCLKMKNLPVLKVYEILTTVN